MPGGEGSAGQPRRTGSGTQPIPQVWHPVLRPLAGPRVAVPLLLVLIGLVVWLLAKSGTREEPQPTGPARTLPVAGKAGPFRGLETAGTRSWIKGREFYNQIECELPEGRLVRFLLITSDERPDLAPST